MPSFPDKFATVVEALNTQNADLLRKLILLLPLSKAPTRKDDRVRLIAHYLEGEGLQVLWSELDELQQAAIVETVHSERSRYEPGQFVAKYGQEPNWGTERRSYVYDFNPSKLNFFFYSYMMPEDLKQRLKAFVPKPKGVTLKSSSELPETVQLEFPRWMRQSPMEVPLTQRMMESAAQQDLLTVLRLIQSGKISVSEKTRLPGTATISAISSVLQGGDYYSDHDEPSDAYEHIGNMKPFAWCLLVQAAGLAELSGKKLQLTKAGQKALTETPASTLKSIWKKWLKSTIFDEFRRIDAIKGQTGKGARYFTAVSGRRTVIATALVRMCRGRVDAHSRVLPLYAFLTS